MLATAAAAGDYEAIVRIAGWAKVLAGMISEAGLNQTEEASISVAQPPIPGTASFTAGSPAAATAARRPRAKDYPEFFRNGATLVKIGWSKSQKAEYEHKAPLAVLQELAKTLVSAGAKRGRFAMESLLPLKSSADGSEIPSYQTYLCLAWLRAQGLVLQHGRQGYSIKPNTDLVAKAQERFEQLPEQRFADSTQK
jgi:hypothetical protein